MPSIPYSSVGLAFHLFEILAHCYVWPHGQNVLILAAELLDRRDVCTIDSLTLNLSNFPLAWHC